MSGNPESLIRKLQETRSLEEAEYAELIRQRTPESARLLADLAVAERKRIYGNDVFIRGLIEFTNICRNDCLYCGLRRSNTALVRYRLTPEEILSCAGDGYGLGFRTFVLQGGEDGYFTDEGRESYQALYDAGADRYLLRHETADRGHYARLHPPGMSFDHRMQCLRELKEIGYQVGCGFMVGSPGQTEKELAKDLKFIETFRPDMCGIGPFIPHHQTPFRDMPAGSAELTCFLLSVIRLMLPAILLPATTALGTIHPRGREMGILAGANVVMPNLSPRGVRKQYELYDNKICTGEESAQCRGCLETRMESIGYRTVTARGDAVRVE